MKPDSELFKVTTNAAEEALRTGKTTSEAFDVAYERASSHRVAKGRWIRDLSNEKKMRKKIASILSHYFGLKDWRDPKEWGLRGCEIKQLTYYAILDVGTSLCDTYSYVGQSVNPKNRWRGHISEAKRRGDLAGPQLINRALQNGRSPMFIELERRPALYTPWRHASYDIGDNHQIAPFYYEHVWSHVLARYGIIPSGTLKKRLDEYELEFRRTVKERYLPHYSHWLSFDIQANQFRFLSRREIQAFPFETGTPLKSDHKVEKTNSSSQFGMTKYDLIWAVYNRLNETHSEEFRDIFNDVYFLQHIIEAVELRQMSKENSGEPTETASSIDEADQN